MQEREIIQYIIPSDAFSLPACVKYIRDIMSKTARIVSATTCRLEDRKLYHKITLNHVEKLFDFYGNVIGEMITAEDTYLHGEYTIKYTYQDHIRAYNRDCAMMIASDVNNKYRIIVDK